MKRNVRKILLVLWLCGLLSSCSDSTPGNTIIDDPDTPGMNIDVLNSPYFWSLASVPADPALFPEASLKNDVAYGKNRALLAWYTIDPVFAPVNSTVTPGYINNDMDALSYPYAREVAVAEVFPGREVPYGEPAVIPTFNLSFYPRERGPYNLDGSRIDQDGRLLDPERRWGGIMRWIDKTNLEALGVKYIQFWILDPFMDTELGNQDGGFLYFNLGDVSDDILKDGFKSFESGLPINGDTTCVTQTIWGNVPALPPLVYSFVSGAILLQDVGFDGLSDEEEYNYPTYANYLNELRAVLPQSTVMEMMNNPFSPFNDPAGDNYVYYLNNYYDAKRFTINSRYKYYNNSQGNSLSQSDAGDSQYQPCRSVPDVESHNRDFSFNEDERFFQYRVAIRPDSMRVGINYITDLQESNVRTRNGEIQHAVWYQFTIPLTDYQKKIGSIRDFSNIRSLRIFMTGFSGVTHLRFATLDFVSE